MRLQRCFCGTWLPDEVAPEVYQNNHSYVHEFSGPTFSSLWKKFCTMCAKLPATIRCAEFVYRAVHCNFVVCGQ